MNVIPLLSRLKELEITIQLVGGNLKINAPKGKFPPGLLNRLKEQKQEVIRFLQELQKGNKYSSIEPVEEKEYHVLSSVQKRLFFIQRMIPETAVYNIPMDIPLHYDIEVERLESILNRLIVRHESLRTSFHMVGEEPVQRIHEEVEFKIEYYDLATEAGGTRGQKTEATEKIGKIHNSKFIIQNSFIRPFDLSQVPLLRVGLINAKDGEYILLIDMHHIITDGASQDILTNEFMKLYAGEELEPLRLQYKDFAEWQTSEKRKAAVKKQEEYWLKTFEEEIPILDLLTDYPRPLIQGFAGSNMGFRLEEYQAARLKTMTGEFDATSYMLLLAIFNVFLSKLSGQEDIVIGTPVAARRHVHLNNIIGMFVNTLPMRNYPTGEKTFACFLKEVKQNTMEAYENQEYPFDDLVEKVSVDRDVSRNPLFDVMFALQNFDDYQEENRTLEIVGEEVGELTTAKFDLTLSAVETGSGLVLTFNYSTSLLKQKTIEKFITYFKKIVTEITNNVMIKISNIEIISPEEKDQILYDFNDTGMDFPVEKTIHRLFEEQVERTSEKIAIVGVLQLAAGKEGNTGAPAQLTYRELDQKSDQLSHVLRSKGVDPGDILGIVLERSAVMIIGILGILKAGCAYVPLNPKAPPTRIKYMLRECNVRILLTESTSGVKVEEETCEIIDISSLVFPSILTSNPAVPADGLAYVIYTSGSTGKPKGVAVAHSNVCPLFHWGYHHLGLGETDRVIQNLAYFFDWSVWEIFITLTSGASLYIVPDEILLNAEACIAFMNENDITALHATPTQYGYFVNLDRKLETLKYLFLGAEKLTLNLLKRSFELVNRECRVFNMYGPTEAAIISTVLEADRWDCEKFEVLSSVPIGPPVANALLLVLDSSLNLCPVNVTGELYIGGDGVAPGYVNRQELNVERFGDYREQASLLPTNFSFNTRYYRTGDLARWLADGNIEFLGRIDHQVKIRGYRIELGEIENQLLKHPGVKEAVVLIKETEGGDKFLCAYIVAAAGETAPELREYLGAELPDYLIPSYFVQLEEIPLNPNGKIDRRALPAPVLKQEEYIAPGNDMEEKLVGIWSDVLQMEKEKIGVNDNFFRLGGHSLKATIMMSGINREFCVSVPLVEVFKTPTIRQLGQYIRGAKGETVPIKDDRLVLLKKGHGKTEPFFFIHDGSGEVEGYIEFCNRLDGEFDSWGIRAEKIENYTPRNLSIEEVAQKYIEKIKSVQAQGPYHIAGWSIGGTIGFEMVRRLEEQEKKIGFFALIDTVPPDEDSPGRGIEFNFESELKLIRHYFPGKTLTKRLEGIEDFYKVWPEVLTYFEECEFKFNVNTDDKSNNVNALKNLVPVGFAQTVPNLDQISIREFISHLNTLRTFDNACNKYIPAGKIDTAVHFFKASETRMIDVEKWNMYCTKPVNAYDIPGDHYSIFKIPGVTAFATLFDRVLKQYKFTRHSRTGSQEVL